MQLDPGRRLANLGRPRTRRQNPWGIRSRERRRTGREDRPRVRYEDRYLEPEFDRGNSGGCGRRVGDEGRAFSTVGYRDHPPHPERARTRGLVGAAELALMKPTARSINTSRGPIVNE